MRHLCTPCFLGTVMGWRSLFITLALLGSGVIPAQVGAQPIQAANKAPSVPDLCSKFADAKPRRSP